MVGNRKLKSSSFSEAVYSLSYSEYEYFTEHHPNRKAAAGEQMEEEQNDERICRLIH
jgi:hypothetical protein